MLKERLKQVVKDKNGNTLTRLERRTVQKTRVKDVKRLSKWMRYLPSTGNMLFWFIQIFLIVLIRSIVPYPYSMGILSIIWLSVSIAPPPANEPVNNVSMLRTIPPLNMKSSTTLERWLAALCVFTQIHAVFGGGVSSINQAFGFIWIMCSSHTLQTQSAADTVRRHFWCITCAALFQLLHASFPLPPNLMLIFLLAAGMNWITHWFTNTSFVQSQECIKHFNIWGIVALLPFTLLYLITSTSQGHNWYGVWCVGMLWQLIRLTYFELIVAREPTSHPMLMLIRCVPSIVSCLIWWCCDSWLWSAVWLLAFVCMTFQAVLREPIEHVVWPSAERAANLILSQESALAKQNPIFGKLIPQLRTVMEQTKT